MFPPQYRRRAPRRTIQKPPFVLYCNPTPSSRFSDLSNEHVSSLLLTVLYTLYCTMYTALLTLYTVLYTTHYTLHTVLTSFNIRSILYTVHCTLPTAICTLFISNSFDVDVFPELESYGGVTNTLTKYRFWYKICGLFYDNSVIPDLPCDLGKRKTRSVSRKRLIGVKFSLIYSQSLYSGETKMTR